MRTTQADMALGALIRPYRDPADIPFVLTVGDRRYRGFPAALRPTVERRRLDARLTETVVTARLENGLTLRAVCVEYRDYPTVEWVMRVTNDGTKDTPILSDWRFDALLEGHGASLLHGNGDTREPNGYEWRSDPVTEAGVSVAPCGDGTSCSGAFPYLRLLFPSYGVNLAVGWSGTWRLDAREEEGGVRLSVGQAAFRAYLRPGETVRSPRVVLQAFAGGEDRGRNLWRSFYLDHVLPREDGRPLPPKLILHTWRIGGFDEFCGATEANQLAALDAYLAGGLRPDIWWIDAGWYPCDDGHGGRFWPAIGTWRPRPGDFPRGLAPIGERCDREGVKLLVWFEPERVYRGTELWETHPEFLLRDDRDPGGWAGDNALLNLGNPAACDWLIERTSALIRESRIRVYRQDLNLNPAHYWALHEERDREGMLENLHIQGYYRFWDALLDRHPGLWIDSCAGGGRRNDYETMRRAVPLHYTDVGYGNHPLKQKQHRQMFEWIPYFRAHTLSWDEPDGSYADRPRGVDEFAYQNALAPAVTSMIEWNDPDETYEVGRRFHPIWRRAARLMLSCDYYPLTECRGDPSDFYAAQFDGEREGFLQIIRNVQVQEDSLTLRNLHADPERIYSFTDPIGRRSIRLSGAELAASGFHDSLAPRSGVIWFYTKE